MEIRFYLKRPRASHSTIFALIHYEGQELKYYLSEKVPTICWNKATQRALKVPKDFPEYPEFNARLDFLDHTIKSTYRKYRNDNNHRIPAPQELKMLLDIASGKTEFKQVTFFSYYEDFNARSERGERVSPKTKQRTSPNTNKGYVTTLKHLKEFQTTYKRVIDFDTIDIKFHSDYMAYLTKQKLSINTIGTHIKRIKTIMSEATSQKVTMSNDFKSSYFFKPQEETDSVYLNAEELNLIKELDLSDNLKLDRTRDLFLIGCYTGLRFSDFSTLKPSNINDGLIEIRQIKTTKKVVIPVHSEVQRIQDKYNGALPETISNQKMNEYIKDICKEIAELKVPVTVTFTKGGIKTTKTLAKWALISTHTARRSFATNEYLAGTPVITIMAITGHKTEKAFLRYIKLAPDEHAKLLKMHWDKRNQPKTA